MRIAYILEKFPTQTEYFILNEIIELERSGFEIIIFVLKKQIRFINLPEIKNLKSTIVYLPKIYYYFPLIVCFRFFFSIFRSPFLGVIPAKINLIKLLKSIKYYSISLYFTQSKITYNHIHAHFAFISTDIAFYISKLKKIKFSFTVHAQDIFLNLKDLPEKIEKASFVITCTKYNKEYINNLTNYHFNEKIFHVYHGINLQKWENVNITKKNNLKSISILSIARLIEKKGLIYLLKAIKELKNRKEEVNCLIIGEGFLKNKLKKFINDNQLQGNVKIEPYLSQAELKQYYSIADIFVLPSIIASNGDRDGIPNVILEAMASATPVISTNISAIGELIKNNENGILVPEKDSISLANAIQYLKSDLNLYNKIIENGINTIYKHFLSEKSTNKLKKIFETCI